MRAGLRGAVFGAVCVALAASGGCTLDFEKFRRTTASDVPGVDAAVDVPADRPVTCGAPQEARLRVAHMAWGFGAVDLCVRRAGQAPAATFVRVTTAQWPVEGLSYGEVSQMGAPNVIPQREHESWDFAVVPHGGECSGPRVAQVSAAMDSGLRGTLLLTSQAVSGRLGGVLGVLVDRACFECGGRGVDVRAVHGSLGASALRLDVSMYLGPVLFAVSQNVPYGSASLNAQDGYECLASWLTFLGSSTTRAQFSVRPSRGAELVRSEPIAIKGALLAQSRRASVFFEGELRAGVDPPGFVVCYDGLEDSGLTVCDRVRATVVDAGQDGGADATTDAMIDAGVDAGQSDVSDDLVADGALSDAEHDASNQNDAGAEDVGEGDAVEEDIVEKDDAEVEPPPDLL